MTPLKIQQFQASLGPAAVRLNEPERRQLTIMACEIVGLATLSARLDPEDLREVVAAYHGCIREVVEQQKGFVAKFLPEGALVCFGYPQANEDDAERAVRAGLAATRMIGDLRVPCLEVRLQARAGIATGLVVVGNMTDGGPPSEHIVIGDTPLLANRLVALADPGAVVMSTATRRLVGKLFECIDLGVAELQHAGEPAGASQVLRENPIGSRFEALRDSRMPLFGREEEFDLLLRRWDQAK